MTDGEKTAILAQTATLAQKGQYELYKTSHQCDGTDDNPEWLG
jgi:hypothetical protein